MNVDAQEEPAHGTAGVAAAALRMPAFNLAAFLIPPIWGPAHGQWAGAVFLPLWLFVDSIVASAIGRGIGMGIASGFVVAMTLAMQAWFARNGYALAWRHNAGRLEPQRFLRRQRMWGIVGVVLTPLMFAWATYFHLVLAA